jgi:phospholipid/cholesterol/gamma-HCH transport system substrate-binding protein
LTGGIIAVAAIVVLIFATLRFARVGVIHGKKVTLYVVTDQATGVRSGTEVWVAGQKSGLVTDVRFRPPSSDTVERLVIAMEVLEDALPNVRKDSYAQVRPSGSLIGTPVVYIAAGLSTSPPLHDGDTLRTREKSRVGRLAADVEAIGPAVSEFSASVKELYAKAKSPVGTIGNVHAHGFPRMPEVSARMSRIATKATSGSGTLGLASRNNLKGRASRVMAAADSIRTLVASNKGSLGRFRRDSTLATKARDVLASLDTLRAFASNPMGRMAAADPDSTLTRELDRRRVLLAALIKDIKAHPLRYINF